MQQLTEQDINRSEAFLWIPTKQNAVENNTDDNKPLPEEGYMSKQDIVSLFRKYKNNPDAIQYLADMMED